MGQQVFDVNSASLGVRRFVDARPVSGEEGALAFLGKLLNLGILALFGIVSFPLAVVASDVLNVGLLRWGGLFVLV